VISIDAYCHSAKLAHMPLGLSDRNKIVQQKQNFQNYVSTLEAFTLNHEGHIHHLTVSTNTTHLFGDYSCHIVFNVLQCYSSAIKK